MSLNYFKISVKFSQPFLSKGSSIFLLLCTWRIYFSLVICGNILKDSLFIGHLLENFSKDSLLIDCLYVIILENSVPWDIIYTWTFSKANFSLLFIDCLPGNTLKDNIFLMRCLQRNFFKDPLPLVVCIGCPINFEPEHVVRHRTIWWTYTIHICAEWFKTSRKSAEQVLYDE